MRAGAQPHRRMGESPQASQSVRTGTRGRDGGSHAGACGSPLPWDAPPGAQGRRALRHASSSEADREGHGAPCTTRLCQMLRNQDGQLAFTTVKKKVLNDFVTIRTMAPDSKHWSREARRPRRGRTWWEPTCTVCVANRGGRAIQGRGPATPTAGHGADPRVGRRPIQSAQIPLKWTTDLNVEAKTVKLPAGKHRGKPSWPSEKGLQQGYRKHQLEKRYQLVFIQTRISAF